MRSQFLNGGAYARSAPSGAGSLTAGGGGDNTAINGPYFDRKSADYSRPLSCKVVISFRAVLAAGATLSIAAKLQDAVDAAGTGAADYGDALASAIVATGGVGGSTEEGTIELDFELEGAREFIRSVVTPDLSAANTDTAIVSACLVLFGADRVPYSKSLI